MNKELYVSTTPHETKVALVEDDQLAEIYFERENEYTLAGSIYKGRVTRVLPGMQSAFVDIGLERDAFLYVSDFLDLEDEDEEFGDLKVGPAQPIDLSQQQQSRQAAQMSEPLPSEAEEELSGDEGDGEGNENGEVAADGTQEESGARRWRGRRRRRGGRRGRGDRLNGQQQGTEQAESAEEPAAFEGAESDEPMVAEDQAPVHEAVSNIENTPAAYEPILLPGESISKYRTPAEGGAPEEQEARQPWPEREERGRGRDRFGRGRRDGRDRGRDRDRDRAPRYEESPLPADYQPIVLPGESISKYRHDATASVAETNEPEIAQASPVEAPIAVLPTFVEQSQEDLIPDVHVEAAHELQEDEPAAVVSQNIEEHSEPQGDVEESPALQTMERPVYAPEPQHEEEPADRTEERFKEMNVASVFGGDAVEEPSPAEVREPEPRHDVLGESVETSTHEAGAYSPEGGYVEHEEIDEEEEDMPHVAAEDFDGYQAHEFEEETMDRNGLISDAVRESETEAVTEDEEYEFNGNGNGDDYEFEESEMVASADEGEEEVDEENGRAELRAPAGTAGYQQRSERAGYERRDRHGDRDRRGRRGGRRMRMRSGPPRQIPMISDLLKEGQEILVQIAKEPIGKKGARITSHIALPGRFLVFMPTVNHVGVSRKINSEEERLRLKRIVASERENGHGGFIVRTAAAGIREEELRADIRFLKHLWSEIKSRAESSKSPALIYHDLNLVERVLRDQVTHDFSQIWVDNEQEYERVVRFANRFQTGLVRRIKLYTKDTPLFEQFGIQEEINKSLKSKVWLKSGGYIVINQTEALVAIDINTGKYVGKTQRLEDTIVKTNVDAIKEIVRQIRLRDLGGIIVIDFIDMDERKNRQKVMQALEEALKADRAPSKVLQFNDFGLVAITRKRVKQSLERTLGSPCPYCTATGFVKSPQTVCNEIYSEMRKISKHLEAKDVLLRVNPEVAKELKGNNGKYVQEMEEMTGRTILVKSDPLLHQEQFDIQG